MSRSLSKKALVLIATSVLGLLLFIALMAALREIHHGLRRKSAERKRIHAVQLQTLVQRGAKADEVALLLGRESRISNQDAQELIRRHAANGADATTNMLKVGRWPSASFFTDGDFTFVVFFDADGRVRDFAIGNQ